MNSKQLVRRGWGLIALMALLFFALGSTLYEAQIINGAYWAERSKTNISDTEQVPAARGNILDRYGRVLVSNRVTYQVTLNTSVMGAERNGILTTLMEVAQGSGVTWEDTLPITRETPFAYTSENPFYTTSTDENGAVTKSLTRLGKLAVKMKWLSGDPTNSAAQVVLPSAEELLGKMCASFEIAGEGAMDPKLNQSVPTLNIGDMDFAHARTLAGLLYELYLRSKEITWSPYIFAEHVDIDFISRVKERSLAGVEIEATTTRDYHTDYAAHLLGRYTPIYSDEWERYKEIDRDEDGVRDYQMDDYIGREGVEQAFEAWLRGYSGKRQVSRDTSGKIVEETWLEEPEPGSHVVSTLDIDLQQAVEDILADAIPALKSEDTEGAACVVLDVNTAEILASVSYPTFNLSTYSADYNETASNPLNPFLNRATMGLYPPGSTFKMVTAIAGLEEGIVTPKTQIRDAGRYTYYSANGPQCWDFRQYGGVHGLQNVTQAIENSCNIYFFDVGRQLGIKKLQEYAAKFGLGEYTGVELPEYKGTMAGPEYTQAMGGTWYDGNTLSVAIGQESSQFSPLQLANYIATLVNGGTLNTPHILKEVKSNDFTQVLHTYQAQPRSTIDIQPENLKAVKEGMLALTTKGSVASAFRDVPVQVGAKTGSAQVSANTESNAVFVCFAPYEDPQIAMALVVEKGGSGSELGKIAASILKYYFSAEETRDEILTENTLIR